MAIEITGKIVNILPQVTGDGKNGTWKKQEFLIETTDQYPKKVIFSVWGDKTSMLQSLGAGMDVKVSFNPESREYNGRWYTDLRAWRIESGAGIATSNQQSAPSTSQEEYNNFVPSSSVKDDLPF